MGPNTRRTIAALVRARAEAARAALRQAEDDHARALRRLGAAKTELLAAEAAAAEIDGILDEMEGACKSPA